MLAFNSKFELYLNMGLGSIYLWLKLEMFPLVLVMDLHPLVWGMWWLHFQGYEIGRDVRTLAWTSGYKKQPYSYAILIILIST